MTKVYLAHSFELRKEVRDKIQPILEKNKFKVINPFYTKSKKPKGDQVKIADKLESQGLNPREVAEWVAIVKGLSEKIVKEDLSNIDRADCVIAVMHENSIGTICEIAYAGIVKNKPVFLITENKRIANHPWLVYATRNGKIVENIDSLITYLSQWRDSCVKSQSIQSL